jgi:2-pyrone-4,6-dicarboxylate lactonase
MQHFDEGTPSWQAPPLACDTHFHVFGPVNRYPYGTELRYVPPLAPLNAYLDLAERLGIERMVFVQPSAYGRDNRCMLDAMAEVEAKTRRGIVDVDEDIADAELANLDAIGIRGVRINVSPVRPFKAGFADKLLPRIRRLDARCAELGWQLDFLLPGWLTTALMDAFARLKATFTLAHMGMFLAREGVDQPGFRQLLALLREGERRCWVKLTGVYRMSAAPGFADAAPMARALIAAAPDRVIWGSDYPHLSFAEKVGSVALFDLLGQWAPEEGVRRKILVDNPQALFGF